MLQVTWADGSRQLLLELAGDAGFLPEVIRERVEASVVVSRRIGAGGRRGVRVAVRRAGPGAALTTQVVADRGVDLAEPELAARVAAELADLREQTGMHRISRSGAWAPAVGLEPTAVRLTVGCSAN